MSLAALSMRNPTLRRSGRAKASGISGYLWPIILVAYAAILPREFALNLAGATLFPYRLALLAIVPFLLQRAVTAPVRLHWLDGVVVLVSVWIPVSLLVHEPAGRALESGLALSLDLSLAYALGRLSIRNSHDFRALFRAFLPGLAVVAFTLFTESMLQQQILRPFVAELAGLPPPELHEQVRLGLFRAAGPFPHPILGGVFLASLLPIAWMAIEKGWVRVLALLVSFSMIFTVSSAALLAFGLCIGLIAMEYAYRATRLPVWTIALIGALTVTALIALSSENGLLSFAARRFSLSPLTGQWRVLIWEFAGAEAIRNPLFGIGLRDWARPFWMFTDSIDAHFLLWSVRFGLVAGVGALIMTLGSALRLLWNARFQHPHARSLSIAISFSLLSLVVSGFTVSFWEGIGAWIILLSGIAVTLGTRPVPAGDGHQSV
ncbi:MAG: O-antigen ligase domain-containing protein [Sphingomonadales bacterium]|nr:MAG: O-antigen ligase domain-containing protein [Sphingomonadales bacterium]